jgi:hypothetical protein
LGREFDQMRILGIVVLCAALAGCAGSGRSMEWETIRQVKVGTTQAELQPATPYRYALSVSSNRSVPPSVETASAFHLGMVGLS